VRIVVIAERRRECERDVAVEEGREASKRRNEYSTAIERSRKKQMAQWRKD
jgi:hypothetical protein